ncbi:RHS repeat-associated core domain-containing protein [Leptobacterium sp. I13]|uniref:RHS repeat-associated core domain-containing protein n=1 Tax=Leptobacterium meishanense TaxID=3128904 RepID=UPI0030EC877D
MVQIRACLPDGTYRYGYQGDFAETDPETGKPAFELRLYDPRINRWLTTDPAGQYHSPYLSMGNNWVNRIDPDGGFDCPPGVTCLDGVTVTAPLEGGTNNPPIRDFDWFKNLNLDEILRNGGFFDNPVNAFNLIAIESLYKINGDEFSAYVLLDENGDEFAFINPHFDRDGEKVNSSQSSYNLPLIEKEDGYYLEVNGTPYKVSYLIHSHPGGYAGGEWPSPNDIDVNNRFVPVIYFNEYNVRRAETRTWQRNRNGGLINPNTILGSQLDLVNGRIKF